MNDDNNTIQKRIKDLEEYMKSTGDFSEKIVNEVIILKNLLKEKNEEKTINENNNKKTENTNKNNENENKQLEKKKNQQTIAEKFLQTITKNTNEKQCEHFFMPTMMSMGENFVIVVCSKCLELRKVGEEQ